MNQTTHNKIVSFIWGIADDVLRDLFKRGKYPDVILPMCVLRRMDAVLEPTKQAVLDAKAMLDKAGITEQRAALASAADHPFYNTSKFTLRDLKSRGSQQQLLADFEDYLNGFSLNVQDILENFKFRNQLPTLSKSDSLGTLINKFLDPDINLGPDPVLNNDGSEKHPGLDNHSMGTIFEELVRKFNEENNEEAGEHWTPRDAVRLMANLIFLPIGDRIKSGSYELYDCACGTGGMLTVAEETLHTIAAERKQQVTTHLYGQEINPETYAICKADMLIKGEGESADHIVGGAEHSTLSHDAFPAKEFDFMLANPPYGKSWKKDLEQMGGKDGMRDPRFKVMHQGEELSLVTRSSDGQMLFLANMAAKMNHATPLGSRIAEVHNGSSLFTGDAGQGESNIRRWLIENDWLEAIVALPLNLFYNTGIATYIWVLTNRKPDHRKGKVQLIDATQTQIKGKPAVVEYEPDTDLRDTEQIPLLEEGGIEAFIQREVLPYTPDLPAPRPLAGDFCVYVMKCSDESFYVGQTDNFPRRLKEHLAEQVSWTASRLPIEPIHWEIFGSRKEAVDREGDLKTGFGRKWLKREYAAGRLRAASRQAGAWIKEDSAKIGYEISFTRHFYKPQPLRTLEQIAADIRAVEKEAEGLLDGLLKESASR